jgi:hypothetical protein
MSNESLHFSNESYDEIFKQIRENRNKCNYNTTDMYIKNLVDKFLKDDLFLSINHQINFWDEYNQSDYIESILIGLPLTHIILAKRDNKLEVIDGKHRIITLVRFIKNELTLCGLKKLTKLNGAKWSNLYHPIKRKIYYTHLRVVMLKKSAEEFYK